MSKLFITLLLIPMWVDANMITFYTHNDEIPVIGTCEIKDGKIPDNIKISILGHDYRVIAIEHCDESCKLCTGYWLY